MPEAEIEPRVACTMTSTTITPESIQDLFTPDSYLTDGRRLMRVDCVVGEGGDFVCVEDCRTLEVVVLAVDELLSLEVRPVQASPPAAAAAAC